MGREGFVSPTLKPSPLSRFGTSILELQILRIKIHMCGMRRFELVIRHLQIRHSHTEPHDIHIFLCKFKFKFKFKYIFQFIN